MTKISKVICKIFGHKGDWDITHEGIMITFVCGRCNHSRSIPSDSWIRLEPGESKKVSFKVKVVVGDM